MPLFLCQFHQLDLGSEFALLGTFWWIRTAYGRGHSLHGPFITFLGWLTNKFFELSHAFSVFVVCPHFLFLVWVKSVKTFLEFKGISSIYALHSIRTYVQELSMILVNLWGFLISGRQFTNGQRQKPELRARWRAICAGKNRVPLNLLVHHFPVFSHDFPIFSNMFPMTWPILWPKKSAFRQTAIDRTS